MNLDETTVAVTLARIETKLDAALVQAGDHENRIRALEARPPGLTPRVVLQSTALAASIVSAFAGVIAFITR